MFLGLLLTPLIESDINMLHACILCIFNMLETVVSCAEHSQWTIFVIRKQRHSQSVGFNNIVLCEYSKI